MKPLIKVLILLVSLQACVEPFSPDITKYDDLLVVDAFLSNEETAAVVKLSRSFPYQSDVSKPETSAIVIVSDEDGKNYPLSETSDGLYESGSDLVAVTGKQYMLRIVTSDGSEYESEFQELLRAAPIDSVDFSIAIEDHGTQGSALNGVRIVLNSDDSQDIFSRYYKWNWVETWEIKPPYPYPDQQQSCWQSQRSSGIHIGTTQNLVSNSVKNENLFFIGTNQNKLSVRYSVEIKQSALTRDNYIYLDKIKKINEGSGGFFDPIPGQLIGNIRKLGDPDYPVIGLFEASEVTTKRIFIDRVELKSLGYIVSGFADCQAMEISDSLYFKTKNYINWWYLFQYFSSSLNDTIVFIVNQPKCFDCSRIGSKIKPVFWNDFIPENRAKKQDEIFPVNSDLTGDLKNQRLIRYPEIKIEN